MIEFLVMKYQIIPKSWSKRRQLDSEKTIQHIQFIDFVKQHNHFCTMKITYSDYSEERLSSRVIYNEIKAHWTVDGMKVAVRLVD